KRRRPRLTARQRTAQAISRRRPRASRPERGAGQQEAEPDRGEGERLPAGLGQAARRLAAHAGLGGRLRGRLGSGRLLAVRLLLRRLLLAPRGGGGGLRGRGFERRRGGVGRGRRGGLGGGHRRTAAQVLRGGGGGRDQEGGGDGACEEALESHAGGHFDTRPSNPCPMLARLCVV